MKWKLSLEERKKRKATPKQIDTIIHLMYFTLFLCGLDRRTSFKEHTDKCFKNYNLKKISIYEASEMISGILHEQDVICEDKCWDFHVERGGI